eukprot:5227667-Pyramimonas_sp.AAC.1
MAKQQGVAQDRDRENLIDKKLDGQKLIDLAAKKPINLTSAPTNLMAKNSSTAPASDLRSPEPGGL